MSRFVPGHALSPELQPLAGGRLAAVGEVRRAVGGSVGEVVEFGDGAALDSLGQLDAPRWWLRRPPPMATPCVPVRREHLVVVASDRHQLTRRHHGHTGEEPEVEPMTAGGPVETALAPRRERGDVGGREHRAGAGLANERGGCLHRVARAHHEVGTQSPQRPAEVVERIEHEREPVRRRVRAPDDGVVEHEQWNDALGDPARLGQGGVVIYPQVAVEEQDRRLHRRLFSTKCSLDRVSGVDGRNAADRRCSVGRLLTTAAWCWTIRSAPGGTVARPVSLGNPEHRQARRSQ